MHADGPAAHWQVKANKDAVRALKVLQLLMGQLARQKLVQQLEVQKEVLRMEKTYNLQEVVIGSLEVPPCGGRQMRGHCGAFQGSSDTIGHVRRHPAQPEASTAGMTLRSLTPWHTKRVPPHHHTQRVPVPPRTHGVLSRLHECDGILRTLLLWLMHGWGRFQARGQAKCTSSELQGMTREFTFILHQVACSARTLCCALRLSCCTIGGAIFAF